MKVIKLILILFVSHLLPTQAQQTKFSKEQLDSLPNTIKNEFVKIYHKSNNWQQYKMIVREDFNKFQKNVIDSVQAIKKELKAKQQIINEQKDSVIELNNKIEKLTADLILAKNNKDTIAFLGVDLNKTLYNFLLFVVIIGLLVGLLIFIFKFKNSHVLTKKAQDNLAEMENEFEEYRKKTIEREQKLRRKLQDEINKQRGI